MRLGKIDRFIPQVRPHYRLQDRRLFFMISRRPSLELSPEEVLLYDGIDGRKTVAELERIHPRAGATIQRWHEAEIVELLPPMTPPNGPHLVVIEPHMDDAALSAGGRLLHRRDRCRITIVSVVGWSNFTTYLYLKRDFLDARAITDLRLRESMLAARLLGAEHRCLNWTDAPLRFLPAERWSMETVERFVRARNAFVSMPPAPGDVSLLAERLTNEMNLLAPDELWIPMGLGDHVDHRTTRSACIQMLVRGGDRFAGIPVVMYEDLPYAGGDHAAQISAAFAARGTRLVRGTEDVTDVFEEKLRLISVYASQFKLSVMEPRIRKCAERKDGPEAGTLAEAYHRFEGEPRLPPESDLSPERADLAALRMEMRALVEKRERCRRLTVMALPSAYIGRWTADRECLLAAFPNAKLRVYTSDEIAWQAEEGGDSRLRFEVVRKGWRGWIGVVLRELFRFRTLTVILWWGSYRADGGLKVKLLGLFLLFRHVLFAEKLGDFCGLLEEQIRNF
ncbi:MAG TPA: PIG-L family deacetylase [Nitrospiria bacterium]|nr:PIG-L family deacetylase [Nitrospiria bacterium]